MPGVSLSLYMLHLTVLVRHVCLCFMHVFSIQTLDVGHHQPAEQCRNHDQRHSKITKRFYDIFHQA